MRIGLNATCFNDRPSGALQRFIGIYGEVFKLMPDSTFYIFEPSDFKLDIFFTESNNIIFVPTPIPSQGRIRKLLKGLNFWPSTLNKYDLDIFECFNLPLVTSSSISLATIHDIRGLKNSLFSLNYWVAKITHYHLFRNINRVITVSDTMRDEIQSLYPDSDVHVVYNGLDYSMFQQVTWEQILEVKDHLNLPNQFLLTVGHFEERKNFLRLIDALDILRNEDISVSLIIIGNNNGYLKKILKKLDNLNLRDQVTILTGLTNLELYCVYMLSNAFIFPSTYEGFGIPILETMSVGKPYTLSNLPVFKEITQNQGNYFNPNDPNDIASSIKEILSNKEEQERLKKYSETRVKDFVFLHLAQQLQTIYLSSVEKFGFKNTNES